MTKEEFDSLKDQISEIEASLTLLRETLVSLTDEMLEIQTDVTKLVENAR